MKLSSATILAF